MKNKNAMAPTIKFSTGQYVHGRLLINEIHRALSLWKNTLVFNDRDFTIVSDKVVNGERIVIVRVEDENT